jgi:hypothetical protein
VSLLDGDRDGGSGSLSGQISGCIVAGLFVRSSYGLTFSTSAAGPIAHALLASQSRRRRPPIGFSETGPHREEPEQTLSVIHDQVHDMPDESERLRNDHRRDKSDKPAPHPLLGDEMRAFRRLRKDNPHGEFVFVSERDASPFTEAGFAKLVARCRRPSGSKFTRNASPCLQLQACE